MCVDGGDGGGRFGVGGGGGEVVKGLCVCVCGWEGWGSGWGVVKGVCMCVFVLLIFSSYC